MTAGESGAFQDAVVVVSDAHLGGPGGRAEPLARQLSELDPSSCREVIFLGDLFHIWVGAKRYETPAIRAGVQAVRDLRSRGVSTIYIEGNRDFFLHGGPYEDAFDEIVLEYRFQCGGRSYLAVHGDGIDRTDRQYLFWRWLSKSALSRVMFRRIPGPLARRIVTGTEQRLAATNFRHRQKMPREALSEFANDRLKSSVDCVLLGHFHQDLVMTFEVGELRIIDAWYETPALVWIDSQGIRYGAKTSLEFGSGVV